MPDQIPAQSTRRVPVAFEAFEETAAYVDGRLTRAQAITEGREACSTMRDDFRRRDLRAVRVFMIDVEGEEAEEAFCGEFDSGWIEVRQRPLNAAQKAALIPMWRVEPRG